MATDLIEEEEFDTGREALQVEQNFGEFGVTHTAAGRPYLYFNGFYGFPSLQHVTYGIHLKPETTTAEAQELANLFNQRALGLWAQFWDRPLESPALYDFGENGLAILGPPKRPNK
jgi:hypothetical protein